MSVTADARQLAAAVHRDPCGGVPRAGLQRALGWDDRRFKSAVWAAWRARRIDFIRDYLVAINPPH